MAAQNERDDLAGLTVAELTQAFVTSVQAAAATEHVGRKNRLARQQAAIARVLRARDEER